MDVWMCVCVQACTCACLYREQSFINLTHVGLSDIPDFQTVHIVTKVITSNFLLLLLYLAAQVIKGVNFNVDILLWCYWGWYYIYVNYNTLVAFCFMLFTYTTFFGHRSHHHLSQKTTRGSKFVGIYVKEWDSIHDTGYFLYRKKN
jgi:hypothetical protein